MATEELVTYRGQCHCGAVQFEVDSEPIAGAIRCNCSICRRKNALMSRVYYPPDRFRLIAGEAALAVYRFPPELVNHYFCSRCGVYPFHSAVEEPERGYRVNLGCIDQIDAHSLPIRVFDGADTWEFLE